MPVHNKKEESRELLKKVRGQVARRYIDSSGLVINVNGSNVNMTGVLRKLRTYPNVDLKDEMEAITKILKTIPGIREVVWDVALRV